MILAACLLLGLTGCTGAASLFTEIKASDTGDFPILSETLLQTPDMLGLSSMKEMMSDGGLTLYVNEKTTEIAVKTKDGTVWYSNPQDRLSYNGYMQGNYSSQILLTQIDASETTSVVNNYEQSVQYGQFNIQKDAANKSVSVEYLFGKKVEVPLYPVAMTVEKYEEIYATLSKSDQYKFSTYYILVDMDS
ncbi:MAG: hypothetical protein IKI63_05565, partial [Clostridia bacterium]|nr:hypothetical protein [Clostridia bacterium]